MGFSLSAWYRLTFNSEFTIRGRLENLQGAETMASRDNNLYLSRRYLPGGRFDYEWRLITDKKLKEGEQIPFMLALGPVSENVKNYVLPIRADFYSGEIALRYDRAKDKLLLYDGSKDQELPSEAVVARSHDPQPRRWFRWTVEAQAAVKPVPIQERLEAADPIIRQEARQRLTAERQQQWTYIEKALADPASSYRVKVGVITALNANRCSDLGRLSPAALGTVIQSSGDRDPTLRAMARKCVVGQASPAVEAALDKALRDKPSGASTGELAKTQLEVLYSLGIAAKDRYGSREAQTREELDRAVADFRKAWELRTLAGAGDQVLFAKALYGWGLALHDRSWIERGRGKARNPQYVRAAQDKFAEFLAQVKNSGNAGAYPYPQHLRQAEAYISNPVPASLAIV